MAQHTDARRQFIETTGDMMEEHGLPHMAGRVFAALQICKPPYLSMDELAEELQASKGAISMATRVLLQAEVIEKLSLPGHRRRYYRVRPGVWMSLFAHRTEHLHRHRELASLGMAALDGEPVEAKERLLEMIVFFDFVEEEMPRWIERWNERYPQLRAARVEETGGGSSC